MPIKVDGKNVVITRTVEEVYDKKRYVDALMSEADAIREQLAMKAPSVEELRALGRAHHPYYTRDVDLLTARLDTITEVLKELGEK